MTDTDSKVPDVALQGEVWLMPVGVPNPLLGGRRNRVPWRPRDRINP